MSRVGLLVVGHVDPKSVAHRGRLPGALRRARSARSASTSSPTTLDEGQLPRRRSTSATAGSARRAGRRRTTTSRGSPTPRRCTARSSLDEQRYVGICFGHQLLAQALGGKVAKATDGWGVGVQEYDIVEPLPCMDPRLDNIAILASHQDQVVDVPPDARVIASAANGYCPVAGLAVGERAWTLQGHPEFVPPLADHLLAGRVELIGAERVAHARASLARPLDTATVAGWIARFFD